MIVSDNRIAANRRNAARSTGPRTAEGKGVARRNALKHGLTAVVVPVEGTEAMAERAEGIGAMLRPRNAWQEWLVEGIAAITTQLDRLAAIERRVRDGASWRAVEFWDDDQRDEAERVGARLARDPARAVGQLRRSPQGCEWLIGRWAMLANVADRQPWTDDQAALAHDLLGTPRELRDQAPEHTVDTLGRTVATGESAADFARARIADLEAHRARVVEADAIARSLAEADLGDLDNRDLARLRRYERDLQARLRRYFEMSQFESPQGVGPAPTRPTLPPAFDPASGPADPDPVALPGSQPEPKPEPKPGPDAETNPSSAPPTPATAAAEPRPSPLAAGTNPLSRSRPHQSPAPGPRPERASFPQEQTSPRSWPAAGSPIAPKDFGEAASGVGQMFAGDGRAR